MQNTSALYKSITSGYHVFETKIIIHGTLVNYEIGEDELISVSRTMRGIDGENPTIGAAIAATAEINMLKSTVVSIPKRGQIDVLFRAKDSTRSSEWIPAGTFFVDTREETEGVETLTINAYDAMIKSEQSYPDTDHDWPLVDIAVIEEIAETMGVDVDERTYDRITGTVMINPPSDYTMREVLGFIAGIYAGNFIISPAGKLLFVPLYGYNAEETGSYLADENGNALTFGNEGWFVFV